MSSTGGGNVVKRATEGDKPEYVSENPEADWQRFGDSVRLIVSVPKKTVDEAIAEKKVPRMKDGRKVKS